jgi:putative methyltransferase (TIGR04325 family)
MSPALKTLLKQAAANIPFVREKYFEHLFWKRSPSWKGIYTSFAEAEVGPYPHRLVGYDHEKIARIEEPNLEVLNPGDYPLLFWFSSILPQTRTVFDLGGNLGLAWYAYRRYLTFPECLHWTVCEVPAVVAAGRELAAKKNADQLFFAVGREDADGADVYFSCGALQYIEEPLGAMLAKLGDPPRHLLINRVPLCDGPTFITLQNNGDWVSPYKVENRDEFTRGVESLGYELVDSWKIPRCLEVLMSPQHHAENFHGMYFRRKSVP